MRRMFPYRATLVQCFALSGTYSESPRGQLRGAWPQAWWPHVKATQQSRWPLGFYKCLTARNTALALAVALGAAACTPTLDWREVRLAPSPAIALLPCKPDRATRSVPLGGEPTELVVAGCATGGATFALMAARLPAGRDADAVLAGWQQATLAHMRASGTPERRPFTPPGGSALAHAQRVAARGQAPDGRPVMAQAAWTARPGAGGATELLHAVVYAERLKPETADAFFEAIRW